MRATLGYALDDQQRARSWTDALRRLIQRAEDAGILVMVNGVVGSTPIDPSTRRSSEASRWSTRWLRYGVMMYLLDANVLITAKNLYYGFELCPGFWDWLDAAHGREVVGSIEQVCDELTEGSDPLSDWAAARRGAFFMESDPAVLPALGQVSQWVIGAGYRRAAVDEFLRVADYHLIATAQPRGGLGHEETGEDPPRMPRAGDTARISFRHAQPRTSTLRARPRSEPAEREPIH